MLRQKSRHADSHAPRASLIILSAALLFPAPALCLPPPAASSEKPTKSKLSRYWLEDGEHYNLASSPEAKFERISKSKLLLYSGTFLLESENEISIQLPMSALELPSHSMALICVSEGKERVYCLLESLTLVCKENSFPLRCGEELLLKAGDFQALDFVGDFDIGVRQARSVDLSGGLRLSTMEFSLIQAMEREPTVSQIVHSRHKHDRFLREKLLKAAAVINYVTSRHGPYTGGY